MEDRKITNETKFEYYIYEWNPKSHEFRDEKKIEITDQSTSAEKVAENYYSNKFSVFNAEPLDHVEEFPNKIAEKLRDHPSIIDELPRGFPDLILYDENTDEIAYCEVKFDSDGLRFSQLKFIEQTEKTVAVAFIREEEFEIQKQVRCSKCGATFYHKNLPEDHSCGIDDSVAAIMNWEGYGFTD